MALARLFPSFGKLLTARLGKARHFQAVRGASAWYGRTCLPLALKGDIVRSLVTAALTAAFVVIPFAATAGGAAAPVYPGAVASARPAGVALKAPPSGSKTYVTSDDFGKVKSWYKAHLGGAAEMAQPGMEKTEDAFLVGHGPSATVVMVQSYKGKTWIVIGRPM